MNEIIWKKISSPWIPEKVNDEISGKIRIIEEEVGENKSKLYTLETKDLVRGVWGCTVLNEKMKLLEVGNSVKIVFLGKKQGAKKEPYKDYDVFIGCD